MNKWIVWLLLPPIAFILPWSVALLGRRWLAAGLMLGLWVAGIALTVFVWSGVGIALLVALGLWSAFTGVIERPSVEPVA
ncbi:hypothetical protein [Rhizobacter sp. LjRoot28]|jgi:hypothetical protein|uniref:hypothetical protein n=1 Tax=Rhizobacter sp. LjRoot28 TaxID=3342309 RepID=UPI003ECC1C3F